MNGLHCPECKNGLRWVGDEEYEENVYYSFYECPDCHIEVFKYWHTDESD